MNVVEIFKNLWTDKHGTVTLEWSIIGALLVVVIVLAYTHLGSTVSEKTDNVAQEITGSL